MFKGSGFLWGFGAFFFFFFFTCFEQVSSSSLLRKSITRLKPCPYHRGHPHPPLLHGVGLPTRSSKPPLTSLLHGGYLLVTYSVAWTVYWPHRLLTQPSNKHLPFFALPKGPLQHPRNASKQNASSLLIGSVSDQTLTITETLVQLHQGRCYSSISLSLAPTFVVCKEKLGREDGHAHAYTGSRAAHILSQLSGKPHRYQTPWETFSECLIM